MRVQTHPASEGRPSSQSTRPSESMAAPPKRFCDPETTSAVNGDFQAPYGVSHFDCPISAESATAPTDPVPRTQFTTRKQKSSHSKTAWAKKQCGVKFVTCFSSRSETSAVLLVRLTSDLSGNRERKRKPAAKQRRYQSGRS